MAADLKIRTAQFAANTGGGTQDLTISGFGTVQGAILIITSATADDTITADAIMSLGLSDTLVGGGMCMTSWAEDALGTSDCHRRQHANRFISILTSSGSVDGEATFNAVITDGIQLSWTDAPSAAYTMTVIFFGGSDVDCKRNFVGLGNVAGSELSDTFTTFKSTAFMHMFQGVASQPTTTADIEQGYGFTATGDISACNASACIASDDNVGTTVNSMMVSPNFYVNKINPSSTVDYLVAKHEITSNGFKWTPDSAAANEVDIYLAIEIDGGSTSLGVFDTPTSTGDHTFKFPGKPSAVIYILTSATETSRTAPDSTDVYGIGFGIVDDAEVEFSAVNSNKDAVTTSVCKSRTSGNVIDMLGQDGTQLYRASHVSFSSDGHVVNFSDVDATPRKIIGLAFYNNKAGTVVPEMEILS